VNLCRRTVNLGRPEMAQTEGSMGPKRHDDTRYANYMQPINCERVDRLPVWQRTPLHECYCVYAGTRPGFRRIPEAAAADATAPRPPHTWVRVQGLEVRMYCVGCRVEGVGFGVQGLGCGV
jgi:hypothetical protein